jgi:two-component system NtrC family sensor kinase
MTRGFNPGRNPAEFLSKGCAMNEINKSGVLLIVDDEPDLVKILSKMLRPVAGTVLTANNGAEGFKLVRSGDVDAVISDINMPIMNGLQMLAEIRGLALLTPVVMLTAFGDKENIREALRLDAMDFIDKPFEQDEVVRVMRKAVELGLAIRQMEAEVDSLFQQSNLPADKITQLKQRKKMIQSMRIARAAYAKTGT